MKKIVAVIVVILILIPGAVLLYDAISYSDEKGVELHYIMADGTMKSIKKDIRGKSKEDIILSSLSALQNDIKGEGMFACIPAEIQFRSVILENAIATVDISNEVYRKMQGTKEAIFRAAIVWTLTSLDFVNGVVITANGEPLSNSAGKEYGVMDRNNIIIYGEISAETTEYAILRLYFANRNKTDLVVEERVVEVNANQAREKAILEQLISGPKENMLQRTIPIETKIRDVTTTSDGICYVDLSQEFVSKHSGGEIEEWLTVFSIVNSLCELEHIQKVQFLVGGEKLDIYKEYIEFKTPFTAISSVQSVWGNQSVMGEIE